MTKRHILIAYLVIWVVAYVVLNVVSAAVPLVSGTACVNWILWLLFGAGISAVITESGGLLLINYLPVREMGLSTYLKSMTYLSIGSILLLVSWILASTGNAVSSVGLLITIITCSSGGVAFFFGLFVWAGTMWAT